jgi:hypothetical protein
MDTYIKLKDSALTEAEKITFIEKVYNEKVIDTKMVKKGDYYFIKGCEENQLPATLDYYYTQALKMELDPEY